MGSSDNKVDNKNKPIAIVLSIITVMLLVVIVSVFYARNSTPRIPSSYIAILSNSLNETPMLSVLYDGTAYASFGSDGGAIMKT